MKKQLLAICAAIVAAGSSSAALADGKPIAASGVIAARIACLKQYGAYEDPQTKRLKLVGGSLTEFQTRLDAIYACVSQKTGQPLTPFIRSEVIIR